MLAPVSTISPSASVFAATAEPLAPLASGAAPSRAGVAAVGTASSTATQVGVALRDRNERPSGTTGLAALLDQSLIRDRVASFRAGERGAQGDAVTSQRAETRASNESAIEADRLEVSQDAAEAVNAAVTLAQQQRLQAANEASFTPPTGPTQEATEIANAVEAAAAANRTAASQEADNAANSVVRPDSTRLGLEATEDAQTASPIAVPTPFASTTPGVTASVTPGEADLPPDTAVPVSSRSVLEAVPTQGEQAVDRAAGPQSALARAAALFSEVDRIAQTSGLEENRSAASPRIRASA
ncbi:MAG: hypothetical protein MUF30_06040 [Burkholderiales bacterium]|jgi:hypothetical protein|nr:hypothetical protein [Burkholderiales bacterium]